MNRGTSTGLLTLGIVMAVSGAILRYAVTVHATGFNIHAAGVILLVVGIVSAILGALMLAFGTRSRSTIEQSYREMPQGRQWTEDRIDSGTSGL